MRIFFHLIKQTTEMTLDVISNADFTEFKAEILGALAKIEERLTECNNKKEWLTESEAMELLDVSKSTIRNYRLNGMLGFSQVKNKIYIKRSDIHDFIAQNYLKNAN